MAIPTMVTIRTAADAVGVSYNFVRNLIREGKIPCVMTGNKFLVNLDKLTEYLNNGDDYSK